MTTKYKDLVRPMSPHWRSEIVLALSSLSSCDFVICSAHSAARKSVAQEFPSLLIYLGDLGSGVSVTATT